MATSVIPEISKSDVEIDRLVSTANQAIHTRSVQILHPPKLRHSKQRHDDEKYRIVHVMTSSVLPTNTTDILEPSEIRINIQPLLVLDLNGILCHRVRRHKQQPTETTGSTTTVTDGEYRPQLGPKVAHTPIIPRPNVTSFLEYLDQHFCLAIWTSAKTKTAKKIIALLIPEPIRERLLFVWAQSQCEVDDSSTIPKSETETIEKDVYRKNLSSVWQKYPLWNADNTLIMDDSPEKCIHYKANAIHPPPLHGRCCPPSIATPTTLNIDDLTDRSTIRMPSDGENVMQQLEFMKLLVHHWIVSPVVQSWDSRNTNDNTIPLVRQCNENSHDIKAFLIQHATGHMGYQVT
jgi:hypothetical protein